jgi:formiminotetrahydrofolate cyclodeaminase
MSTPIPAEAYQPPPELPSLTQFAQSLANSGGRASAGATAALAVALAADLIAQVAERSPTWEEHRGALAQADVVRNRATAQGRDVAVAYHRVLAALDEAIADPGPATDSSQLGRQLATAADLLLEIAETACDCAALAVAVAKSGDTVVRADATAAAVLAAAGAEMAAHLVEVNLLASTQQDRTARARQLASAAAQHRSAALGIMA